jgi:hypothetical protein
MGEMLLGKREAVHGENDQPFFEKPGLSSTDRERHAPALTAYLRKRRFRLIWFR